MILYIHLDVSHNKLTGVLMASSMGDFYKFFPEGFEILCQALGTVVRIDKLPLHVAQSPTLFDGAFPQFENRLAFLTPDHAIKLNASIQTDLFLMAR